MTESGPALYPAYDQSGYLQKPAAAAHHHQRMLHASTPIEFSPPPPEGDPHYPPDSTALGYYPQQTSSYPTQTGLPDRGPPPHTGGYGETARSLRPSYYAQDVSDGSSSSQTRLSGPSYEEPAGSASSGRLGYHGTDEPPTSAAAGRTGYYESEAPPLGRPERSLGRSGSRTRSRSRSRSRSRQQDLYAEVRGPQYRSESPVKPGLMATPV